MVPVLIKVIALISLSFFQFAQASYIAYISILHDLPPLSEGSANPVCCVIFYLLLRPSSIAPKISSYTLYNDFFFLNNIKVNALSLFLSLSFH